MPISGNSSLDTAYQNVISAFDTFASELQTANTEEEAVPAGSSNDEYQMGSSVLESDEFKRIQRVVNQMRKESGATSDPKYFE